jgi:hypothetical protein
MSGQPALAQSLAQLAPVDVPDAYADGVAQWLGILADHIALFIDMDLPDTVEPAPVFCA